MVLRSTLVLVVITLFNGAASAQTGPNPSAPLAPLPMRDVSSGGNPDFHDAALGCQSCGDEGRMWLEAEYLSWWVRGNSLPALVTTSPVGTPLNQAGVLGTPGATVVFGNSKDNGDLRSGFRITAGGWLDEEATFGVEASYFLLEGKATRLIAASDGSVILARPFVDAGTGFSAAQLVAFPGNVSGAIQIGDASSGLTGLDVLFRERLCCDGNWHVTVLGGYRYLHFADRLGIFENITSLSPNNPFNVAQGTQISVADAFSTRNQFNGFDAGFDFEYRNGRLSLDLLTKLAVGPNQQTVDIGGSTTVSVPGAGSATNSGGFLALASNSGHFNRSSDISVIPEIDIKLGYQLSSRLRATIGYTLLYWTNVVRSGNQIDTTINSNLLPPAVNPVGPASPAFSFQRTDLLVQGFNLGLEFRY